MEGVMRKLLLSLASLIAFCAVDAYAADMPVRKAPAPMAAPQQAVDWSGLYAGLHFGGAFGHWETGEVSIHGYPTGISPGDFHASGAILGAHIGWNYHLLPSIVIGVEADYQKARVDNTRTILAIIDVKSSLESYATARARLGVAHGPILAYVTGGYAWGKTETDVLILGGLLGSASADVSRHGYTYGAGIDLMATPNFIVGLAYKHIDLGSKTLNFGSVTVPSDLTVDEITVRAALKF
jgi:outer membrane immunogenic protein